MSLSLSTFLPDCLSRMKATVPVTVCLTVGLFGCSSFTTPNVIKKLSLPDISIPENDPSFRRRLYVGGSFGQSTLNPDTDETVFTVSNSKSTASQFRLGMDLHNKLSVELETSVLGSADFAQNGTDVSYTSASLSALIYGLTGVQNRSRREGWSGYGRLGYGLVQHSSIVEPFDYSDNSVLLGLGAEYGFRNGLALRADVTRVDNEATVLGFGGVYRFGMTPRNIGQVFVNAAKPALGAARTNVAQDGRTITRSGQWGQGNSSDQAAKPGKSRSLIAQLWQPKVSKNDNDGDGVLNTSDDCAATALRTIVNKSGCGMFDAVMSDVTFKPGSVWLTPRARGALDSLTITLLAFPEARIQVRAHTDSDGPADLNLGLSARRAESVVAYLQEQGIGELQLETLGLGESTPIDSNDTKAGKKRNRRVELVTLPNVDHQTILNSDAAIAAVNISQPVSKAKTSAPKLAAAKPAAPVFPPMSGVKIEALPKSAYVAGLSLGGILHNVGFKDNTATLTPESMPALQSVSEKLSKHPNVQITVMGHTDNQLSEEESRNLSMKQAESVVKQLVSLGVDAARMSAEGYGSNLPLAQNLTKADRQRNQRIEIRVLN